MEEEDCNALADHLHRHHNHHHHHHSELASEEFAPKSSSEIKDIMEQNKQQQQQQQHERKGGGLGSGGGDPSCGSSCSCGSGSYDQHDHASVEAWLDENPEFFQDYLIRKGGRGLIDAWLMAHALPPGISTTLHNVCEELTDEGENDEATTHSSTSPPGVSSSSGAGGGGAPGAQRTFSCGSKGSSGSGTPVRKISAHEFEKGGLIKPLVTTIDGTPTFLSPPSNSEVSGTIRKRSRNDIQDLNETDLIFELVKDICNDLDVRRLCHKILQNVGILTYADR